MKRVLLSLLVAGAAVMARADGQFLMVNEDGEITPKGYTLGLDQIADTAAAVGLASNRVAAVAEATAASRDIVSNLTEVLVGNNTFGYIDGFVVSFGGVAAVSTNAACRIVKFQVDAETNGDMSGHYIWYCFTEPMNSTPYVKWKSALSDDTWNIVPTQDLVHYQDGTYLDGVPYNNLYRSTAWMNSSLSRAFYMAYCDIATPDGDGSAFPIVGPITIQGESGFSGAVTNDNAVFTFVNGLLMRAPQALGE